MKVKIDIDTNTFIRLGLVVIGFIVSIFLIVKARQPLTTVGVSMFLALALNPPVSKIAKRLPGKSRIGATAIAYVLVLSIIGGALFLIIPPVIEQSSKFANTVPNLIDQVTSQRYLVDDFVSRYGLEEQLNQTIDDAKNKASEVATGIGGLLVGGATQFLSGTVTMLFILVLTFLMLVEGPQWLRLFWGLYEDPVKLKRHREVVHKMYRVVTGYVNGQMLVALTAATCTCITLLILSFIFPDLPVNIAIPMATLIFITGLIPMIGATIGAVLVTAILLLNSFSAAIIFLIYFIIYQQVENNFISPVVQSKTVELSALMVLIAVLIGTTLFGLLGGLISIPIAGCIRVLMLDYLSHAHKEREQKKAKNPLAKLAGKLKD